jgi:uncharacterized protein YbbC (DUF1343 family)
MKRVIFLSLCVLIALQLSAFSQSTVVKTGIEVLRDRNFDLLKGKKVGLITNPTGVDRNLKSTIDILFSAKEVKLVALFGPEHGVRGDYPAGEYVEFYTDSITQLPVYSLYGKTRRPTKEMLKGIDVLLYDIQDIGCRSYTYISTMGIVMDAAAENGIEVIVLDRPNPLGGNLVEGNLTEEDCVSFVSQFKVPYLYGLTCGELAKMLNDEGMLESKKKCKLTVVPMEGWTRTMIFEQTGLPWVLTSPHIPHPYSAIYYPVTGILGELYSVSIGVGYTLPFQLVAAEWIEPNALAAKLNAMALPGIIFRPISFKAYYSVGKDKRLGGVQIYITDYSKVESLALIQFYILEKMKELYPAQNVFELCEKSRHSMFDKVSGSKKIRELFTTNFKTSDIKAYWMKDAEAFKALSAKYYLYPVK